ncbi:hypothetical protein Patl1_08762 [Pistacia atlantica]|uniref:Uncharacterized protein n=1 Tax=Pistacia atlantica TaxID=434234 RepID=A0ACC1AFZ5_9ROSI|nr:hypothetical protein Patl1_08762 [Pistacia atlantica]
MCYKVRCSTCGKTGWGGCGNHLSSVYKTGRPAGVVVEIIYHPFIRASPKANTVIVEHGLASILMLKPLGAQPSSSCTIL